MIWKRGLSVYVRHLIQLKLDPLDRREIASASFLESHIGVVGHVVQGANKTPVIVLCSVRKLDDGIDFGQSELAAHAEQLELRADRSRERQEELR